MRTRGATDRDAQAITRLEAELLGPDAWSEQQVRDELGSARGRVLVAAEGDVVVGFATTVRGGDVADLNRIAVDVAHQRRGIARALLDEALRLADDDGAARMLLEVSAENSAALAVYEQAGFTEIDRRPRYYRDGSDAIVMQRALSRATEARQEDTVHG